MAEEEKPIEPRTPRHLEQEEAKLWRMVLWFLILLATAVAALSWDRLQNLPYRLGAVPIGLLALAILFAVYSYGRKKQVVELQALLRGLQDRVSTPPTEEQLDQLGQLIARSQRSFKELIDSIDDVAFAISLDGTIRTVNRRFTELLQIPYTAIVGHKLDEFLEEPKRETAEKGLARFIERRRWSGVVQVRLQEANRTLFFDCVLNGIVKGDEVVGISVLARDVTDEREKERRFTELFETLQEGVYFSTPEGRILEANASLVRMLGYETKQELLSVEPNALNPEPNQNAVLGRTAEDQGGIRTREISLKRKDGKTSTFLDSSRAVWDNSGRIIRYQGTLVDITERRNMEATLRQQEEFRRHLLESFPDLILVLNMNKQYSFVSSRIRDLLGFTPEDLIGKKVGEEGQDSKEFLNLCNEVVSGEKRFGLCEYTARHRDSTFRTMRASASPLFDAEQSINGVIVSVRDITVEKKMEQQIIQSERLAAMGQMIGGFAHELNNPLTSILGIVELMQEVEKDETVRKQLNVLQQQSRRAAEIVQNLTYFSRPPSPGKSSVQLGDIVQRTLHLHAYSLRKNNITVDFLPEADIPQVSGDPHQLMQVFLNLILNAEQAIREVRDKGTIRIRLSKTQDQVMATFQDDGPGIASEILSNIFDPFYTTKRPGRGTGLGLSICKAIIREHGGNVEASSGPGGGAVFTVSLPVAPPQTTAP